MSGVLITHDERARYRRALKQVEDLQKPLIQFLEKGVPLDPSVALILTEMTNTAEPVNQLRALQHLYREIDKQYDDALKYAAQFKFSPFCEYIRRNEVPAQHQEFLIEYMERVHRREVMRLAISLPPGSAKTTYASHRFAAWHLGLRPDDRWLQGAHTQTFAKDRLGKVVRNLMQEQRYLDIFPDMKLSSSSSAADYFEFTGGTGYYKAIGVGQGISGFRADIGAIDDPIASREDAESPTLRRKLHEWYEDDFGTRPMPGSPIYIVACLTGDTPVHMADGTWKYLVDINPGDVVVTYRDGVQASAPVKALLPQKPDEIIEMQTGNNTVRGNARHPILVDRGDRLEWVRLENIQIGDRVVVTGAVEAAEEFQLDPEMAWVVGFMLGDGWVTKNAKKNYDKVRDKYYRTASWVTCIADCPAHPEHIIRATTILQERFGAKFKLTSHGYWRCEKAALGRFMASWGMMDKAHGKRLPAGVFSAPAPVRQAMLDGFAAADGHNITTGNYRGVGFTSCNRELARDLRHLARGLGYAVSALYEREDIQHAPNSEAPKLAYRADFKLNKNTSIPAVASRAVTKIGPAGYKQMVYDLCVDGDENFVADGVVVHNTRWHEDDLIGHELQKMAEGKGEHWEVINIPALAGDNDPLGREVGAGLWPEVFGTEFYHKQRRSMTGRSWNSLYQGSPVDEEGGVLKRADVDPHRYKEAPRNEVRNGKVTKQMIRRVTLSVDCAEKATQRSDWTAATVWAEAITGKHYLIHATRCRKEFVDMCAWIDELADIYDVNQILVEDRGAGTQYIQVKGKSTQTIRHPVIPIQTKQQSKEFRFDGVTPMFSTGVARLPESGTDWIADVEAELFAFPAGKNDDYVDSVSQYLAWARERSGNRRGVRKMKGSQHAR